MFTRVLLLPIVASVALAACSTPSSKTDAGSSTDAGTVIDAGYYYDAGSVIDSGSAVDSGSLPDAGPPLDAGADTDAGTSQDAGALEDAGPMIDAGPYDAGGLSVSTLSGNGNFGYVDGPANMDGGLEFDFPSGLTIDSNGSIYVADSDNQRIRKISSNGTVSTVAGDGNFGSMNGPGGSAEFINPTGVTVDPGLNVYVADDGNDEIRMIDPMGNVSTLAGVGDAGYMDGPGATALFASPVGVAVDRQSNVYVADELNFRIRKIDSTGNVTTLAGNGMSGYMDGTGGAGGTAQFGSPAGVAVDSQGNVFVVDSGNNNVRKVDSAGNVTTLAGNGMRGWVDGTGGATGTAEFLNPSGVAVDSHSNVFVADTGNNRIRKIDPMGNVTTLAGNGTYGFADGTGGFGGEAEFRNPTGVCIDATGDVIVADSGNSRIRKITQSSQ